MKMLRYSFYSMLPDFQISTALWKVPRLRPFVLVWAIGGMMMMMTEENLSTWRTTVAEPLRPICISHGLGWYRTRVSLVKCRQLAACAMARPLNMKINPNWPELYLKFQLIQRTKHSISVIGTNPLMLYRQVAATQVYVTETLWTEQRIVFIVAPCILKSI
jgi:hypothetical protein